MDPTRNGSTREESSQAALALAQRLLVEAGQGSLNLSSFLRELAGCFHSDGAGLAESPAGQVCVRERLAAGEPPLPWTGQPMLLANAAENRSATVLDHEGQRFLCCPAGEDRVLWLEAASGATWTEEETAALTLIGLALARRLALDEPGGGPRGGQQRLEDAVLVARRLAHVYSNVLTSIYGFVEMSLAQAPPNSTLKRYLDVAFRGAQQGVTLTQRLRLLGCKATAASVGVSLLPGLARQIGRRMVPGREVEEILDVPGGLPLLALSNEQLSAVLDVLLDNAHEALEPAGGRILIAARLVQPTEDEIRETWGRMGTGMCVCLDVTDTGPGLGSEARLRLFRQPFFTAKPRHHGLGLTILHSIVSAQQGGMMLFEPPTGGLTARVYIPILNTTAAHHSASERRTAL